MVDPTVAAIIAVILLLIGIVTSLIPLIPGGAISLSGVVFYWWSTGYTSPDEYTMAIFVAFGLTAVFLDWFGGTIAASMGGAGKFTVFLSMLVGLTGLVLAGPLGLVIGFPLTIFIIKFATSFSIIGSLRATAFTFVGMLGGNIMQLLLTIAMLVWFVSILLGVAVFEPSEYV